MAAKTFVVLAEGPSKTSGRIYSVRRDAAGIVYCQNVTDNTLCTSWKFNRQSPKTCKHIRQYYAETATMSTSMGLSSGSVATFGPKSHAGVTTPVVPTYKAEAAQMLAEMIQAAGAVPGYGISMAQRAKMVDRLALKLLAFRPVVAASETTEDLVVGVRMITFDD